MIVENSECRSDPDSARWRYPFINTCLMHDLLVMVHGRRLAFEFRRTSAPRLSRGIRMAQTELELDELTVIHSGSRSFPLAPGVAALAAEQLLDGIWQPPDGLGMGRFGHGSLLSAATCYCRLSWGGMGLAMGRWRAVPAPGEREA